MGLGLDRIYLGDSLVLDKEIPDKSVDLILEDMPYGTTACKFDQGKISEIQNDFLEWINDIPFKEEHLDYLELFYNIFNKLFKLPIDLAEYWKSRKRIIKDNGAIVLTASQPFTSMLVVSNLKMFKYEWVWYKVCAANFMNIKNRPLKTQENILIFSINANLIFNPILTTRTEKSLKRDPIGVIERKHSLRTQYGISHYGIDKRRQSKHIYKENGLKHPIDIIEFNIAENGRYKLKHPTKKPVALFEYLIKTYTNEGDLVFDGFAGSGTTGVACINTNRRFICIEKEKEYFDLAEKRIKEAQAQMRLGLGN